MKLAPFAAILAAVCVIAVTLISGGDDARTQGLSEARVAMLAADSATYAPTPPTPSPSPTASPSVSPSPSASASPSSSPSPSPSPSATPDIEGCHETVCLRKVSVYESGGQLHVVGEVYNTGDRRAANVNVRAYFFNAEGEVIASAEGPVEVAVLPAPGIPPNPNPNGTPIANPDPEPYDSPFHVAAAVPAEDYANYAVEVLPFNPPLYQDITRGIALIEDPQSPVANGNSLTFSGTAFSSAAQTQFDLKVIVALYGADGRVLRVASAPLNPSTLPDEGQGTFSVTFTDVGFGYDPSATRFWVDGYRMVS